MKKINKSNLKNIIHWINSNMQIAIPFYTLYYLLLFYLFTNNSNWSWIYLLRSLSLGVFSGLYFRFVMAPEGYNWKKRFKIALLIMVVVATISAVVEILIKRIT